MKNLTIRCLLLLLLVFSAQEYLRAQCPASKYGLNPVWPVNWDQTDRQNWYIDMSVHGQGFQSDGRTWRQLNEMVDSNEIMAFRDEVIWAKTNGGIQKYLFQFKNPASVSNQMPPVWCGNPLTDTNTTEAMYRFIVSFLDTMNSVLDYFILGSETDIYFKARPAERDSFFVLANRVSDYIDLHFPQIMFGVGVSMNCPLHSDTLYWSLVSQTGDVNSVSWWPLDGYYCADTVEINSSAAFIDTLLLKSGTKPVVISDCGVTSAGQTGRSSVQSEFVRNTFLYTMNEPQIEAVGYYYLADFDTTQIYWQQNFNLTYSTEFYESIKSRGLLDSLGNPKPAYDMYLAMLDTVCAQTAIVENRSDGIEIWPNPTDDRIYFRQNECGCFSICDMTGRILKTGLLSGVDVQEVSVSDLPNGTYFLIVVSGSQKLESHLFIKNGRL
ncbi:hypothetical protein SDC9_45886 [bioreactor metagenome]|uniref:Secretion system C-terminal sorting domain-containing protein n=1 Tax=bioreactor metagenome TaxID=1076179 RepID=A0A644W848_9ZZZZ